jgi:hypothetical protein
MLLQWPDVFYHTGGDNMETICPHLIAKSTSLTTAYLYKLSNLSQTDVRPILDEMLQSFTKAALQAVTIFRDNSELHPSRALEIVVTYFKAAVMDFKRFIAPCADFDKQLQDFADLIEANATALKKAYGVGDAPKLKPQFPHVPKRLSEAVLIGVSEHANTEEQKSALKEYGDNWAAKHGHGTVATYLAQYLIDGKRTIDEIAEMIIFECRGGCKEAVYHFLDLYKTLGFCEF